MWFMSLIEVFKTTLNKLARWSNFKPEVKDKKNLFSNLLVERQYLDVIGNKNFLFESEETLKREIKGIQSSKSRRIPSRQIPTGFWSKYASSFEYPERYWRCKIERYFTPKITLLCECPLVQMYIYVLYSIYYIYASFSCLGSTQPSLAATHILTYIHRVVPVSLQTCAREKRL